MKWKGHCRDMYLWKQILSPVFDLGECFRLPPWFSVFIFTSLVLDLGS